MKQLYTLGLLFLMASPAQALDGYYCVGEFNITADSSTIPFDSVIFAIFKTRADTTSTGTGAKDSATTFTSTWPADSLVKPRRVILGHLGEDSLTYAMSITDAYLDADYMPTGIGLAFTKATPGPQQVIRTPLHFTRVLDVKGTGANPKRIYVFDTLNNALVIGAEVVIRTLDTVGYVGGGRNTNGSGFTTFSLDDGTDYPVTATASGFLMQTAYELITMAGADESPGDTVYVYPFVTTIITTTDDSAVVIINTDVPFAKAKIWIVDPVSAPVKDTNNLWIDKTVIRPWPEADANGVIQVGLIRYNATRPQAVYKIELYNARKVLFATFPKYKVPDAVTTTLSSGDN